MASAIPTEAIDIHNQMVYYLGTQIVETELNELKNLFRDNPLTPVDIESIRNIRDLFECLKTHTTIDVGDYSQFVPKLQQTNPNLVGYVKEKENEIKRIIDGESDAVNATRADTSRDEKSTALIATTADTSRDNKSTAVIATTADTSRDNIFPGSAGNFHKTDNAALSYGTIQAMGKSDLNKSVGIIKIKRNGQVASSGSGFRFGNNYVMTAYHVLEDIIEDVWKLAIAKVERSDQKGAIYQEIRSMFSMSSTDIKPKRQALPFGQLFKYLHDMGLQVEVFEEKWKNAVSIEFGVKEGKVTAGEFHFEYDIPFADRDHDVVVVQINEDIHDLLPPLVLEENVVANTVHLFGYPEGSTEIDLRTDIECTVYTDGQKLESDVSEAIKWWQKERTRDVENDYAVCRYDDHNYTDTGKMFLHTSKQFENRSSGCPAVTFIKEQPVVQLMYLRGYPEFCYRERNFPQSPQYLFEAGISMPVVTQLLLECCPQVMK